MNHFPSPNTNANEKVCPVCNSLRYEESISSSVGLWSSCYQFENLLSTCVEFLSGAFSTHDCAIRTARDSRSCGCGPTGAAPAWSLRVDAQSWCSVRQPAEEEDNWSSSFSTKAKPFPELACAAFSLRVGQSSLDLAKVARLLLDLWGVTVDFKPS
jgi:hypothetical protein